MRRGIGGGEWVLYKDLACFGSLVGKKVYLARSCKILAESCKTMHGLAKISSKILQDLTR